MFQVNEDLACIKGGGGAHLQEKLVASCAEELIVVADYRKESVHLGQKWKKGVPLEVSPLAYVPVMQKLSAMGGQPLLRMAKAKAGEQQMNQLLLVKLLRSLHFSFN